MHFKKSLLLYKIWFYTFFRVVAVASKNKRFKWKSEDNSIVTEVMDKVLLEQLALSSKGIDER